MAAKEKAILELDSKLFVISENWHKKRILKCHVTSESETVCHPEELKPISVLRLTFTIAGSCMILGCMYVIYTEHEKLNLES